MFKKLRKLILSIVVLILLILFVPHPFVKDVNRIEYIRITYHGETAAVSTSQYEQIKNTIAKVWCIRICGSARKVIPNDIIEIDFIADDEPCHIVLGKQPYCYHSAGFFKEYRILNQQEFVRLLDSFFATNQN